MITLKQYYNLDKHQKETVRVMIVSLMLVHLKKDESIGIAKRRVYETKQFSQNLIWYIYDNCEELQNYVKFNWVMKKKRGSNAS